MMHGHPLAEADLTHILCHTGDAFAKLAGRRLVLTGCTGFFGKWLLEAFSFADRHLNLEMQLLVLTRAPAKFKAHFPWIAESPAIEFIEGDVRTFTVDGGPVDYVLHGATSVSPPFASENPVELTDVIVNGTRQALAVTMKRDTKRFLLISSGAVYGTQPPDVAGLREEYVSVPDQAAASTYGEAKRTAEVLAQRHSLEHGLSLSVARCFAFIGPHLPLEFNFAAGNFIRDGLRGDPILIKGDGTTLRSYMYAADLVIWLIRILVEGAPGATYNVGSGDAVSIADLARLIAERCPEHSGDITVAGTAIPGALPARYIPDVRKAGEELDLHCRIPLPDAISRTVAWYLEPE